MGDASPPPKPEYVLALLPFEEDDNIKKILASVKSKHPGITIEYHNIKFTPGWKFDASRVPAGMEIKTKAWYGIDPEK